MPLAGAVSRVSIFYLRCLRHADYFNFAALHLSILYLRCRRSQRKGDQLAGPFNSLFEMQNLLERLANADERVSFNSLFEMLAQGWRLLRHEGGGCFQFSI
jgi:hypothetical protein